jgi:hypothetical protein
VRRDRGRLLRAYRSLRRRHEDVRGVLAAYVADSYLLGQRAKGWRFARRALRRGDLRGLGRYDDWPSGRKYLRALRRFLRRKGYARA